MNPTTVEPGPKSGTPGAARHRLAALAACLIQALIQTPVPASGAEGRVRVEVPRADEVGAACLPATIAPVTAPFPVIEFRRPEFPEVVFSIDQRGAVEGQLATPVIQAAIDELSSRGGGTVRIPPGRWQSGRITLRSNVNLHLAGGAELAFSGEIGDYQPPVFTRSAGYEVLSTGALIYANGQDNIAITGGGKLVGPPRDSPIRRRSVGYGSLDKTVSAEFDTPVHERVYDGVQNGGKVFLPAFISPINCTRVFIEGVTLERTAFWNIVPVYCDGVIIRGVTVNSVGIPMGDGLDIESSRNVLIEYSTLNAGDDCFTMKAGRNEDGLRVDRPTENVVVRHCLARKGHGGITLGSETAGTIRNLHLHDCVFDGTGTGIRFKTRRPRGGGGRNITLERIRMNLTGTAIKADMLGSSQYVGELAERLPLRPATPTTPRFSDVLIRDIIIERTPRFIQMMGIPESPFRNVRIENAEVDCDELISIADARDLTIVNASLRAEQPRLSLLDVAGLRFERVEFNPRIAGTSLSGDATADIRFVDCTPAKPADWETPVLDGAGD